MQPRDQNLIQQIKLKYRRKLLMDIVSSDDTVTASLKRQSLKDVILTLMEAWDFISTHSIVSSWKKRVLSQIVGNENGE